MWYTKVASVLILSMLLSQMSGCNRDQYSDISSENIGQLCSIDPERILVIEEDSSLEFKYELPYAKGVYQSVRITMGPTSRSHLKQIRVAQAQRDFREYPTVGDGAFIHDYQHPPWLRTMWISDGDRAYRVQSMISGCNNDTKLLGIARLIIGL